MRELSYDFYVSDLFLKDFKEEVWVGTELVREAWCTELPEAAPIIQDVVTAFPEITTDYLKSNKSNIIGYATNYRPPYSNGCVSWYSWEYPSAEDLQEYSIQLPEDGRLNRWFGKKFDLVSNKIWLKYVFSSSSMRRPSVPKSRIAPFYARIADQDGNVLPEVDVYFNASSTDVRQICEDNGLLYPQVPHLESNIRRLWSFVYDYDTLEISKVKSYDIFNYKKRQAANGG